ncbi:MULTISPECIES: discoidin domain-containing protein [unclassified Amycolatopsis]|uniref:discoidin domain-containing protein n=1 Tax=unclassified Amycolatopsis TaxID=2618356 RepID=UPI002875CC00|nr:MULTISPECIES: discoidin domain-containing protein [unclassified Amycolatopsis]MDS0135532.1 discoidin domain-containing protein [Amycolatopsis sp. 505]MDS0140777.1 discoidin domain-containing protein [Amycolatopsis sp. CM201R]
MTMSRIPALLAAALAASGLTLLSGATPAAAATCPTTASGGASVPFRTVEAECSATNGSAVGPDYTQASIASEASGRQAVRITTGQYVEFTLPAAANSINVHYNVPDGSSGRLTVSVNGTRLALPVTSRYSYVDTGWIPGAKTHHFFDDARLLLGQNLAAGAKVRVQADSGDVGQATIDLADFEQVGGAGTKPANALSVTDYGATANDSSDDSQAFRNALSAARSQGREVWVPSGRFEIGSALQIDQTTVRGAGQWYTVLHGNNIFNNGSASGNIKLYDFAVFGDVTERNDGSPDNAFHGVLGTGSVVSGLWIQDTKCGLWLMNGASSNLTIENNRILDTQADGVNFDGAVTNSTLRNNYLRNNGDDGLALWSNGQADSGNSLVNNTVVQPNLANGIALYGGSNNTVSGNLVQDTNALGGGYLVANRFNSVPLSGTVTLSNNTALRAGALDPNWQFGVGALWFDARDQAITGVTIRVTGFTAIQSPYEAIQFIDGNGAGKPIQGITIDGVTVQGVGTFVAQSQTQGAVSISNLTASGVGVTGTYNCPYPTSIPRMTFGGSGNSGWTGTWSDCSTWPAPNSGPPQPPQSGTNLARGKAISASGSQGGFPPSNANDGDAGSYWESANNAFPQTLTVDLGTAASINKVTLKLPPSSAWGARTQTVTISGSTDGGSYTTLVGSRGYTFDPASGNTASVSFATTSQRFVRLTFIGNTGWPAGQVSEFEVAAA